jgi:multidrug efflux pump subunit AcrA (membrane-fusion protein)
MSTDRVAVPQPPDRLQPPPGRPVARRHRWRVALAAVTALLVLGLIFVLGYIPRRKREQAAAAAAQREANRIPVVPFTVVQRSPAVATLLLPGNITPLTEAYIYARATGYVRRRFADIGDRVHQGQLLAEIDAPDLDAQVAQARALLLQSEKQLDQTRAALENSRAQEDLARVTWERYRALVEDGAVSRQDADTQSANYRVSQANMRLQEAAVRTAEQNVNANRANLDHILALQNFERVVAPFDGVITARNFDVGAFITVAGSTAGQSGTPNGGTQTVGQLGVGGSNGAPPSPAIAPTSPTSTGAPTTGSGSELYREAQIAVLRILINVPQDNAATVGPGQSATVYVQEYVNRPFPGKVTRTSRSLDQTVRTLLTEVDVQNPQLLLLPGMYAQVEFAAQRRSPPLLIPGDAVRAEANGLLVGVLQPLTSEDRARLQQQNRSESEIQQAMRINIQTVQVGRDYGTAIEITDGLKAGDQIVTNPGDMVRPGAIVLPQAAPSVVGEGVPQRNTENARHPGGIGSPSMVAPTGGQPQKGGK